MENEILNKILVQVEKIGTDLTEFKQEMHEFKDEMKEFKQEMYEFKDEVKEMFDQNTLEIADEIHEVSKVISRKTRQIVNEIKQEVKQDIKALVEVNEKEHAIFKAQIEKLQCIEKYLPKPFSNLAEINI